jgi:hypothetical protein
MLGMTGSLYMNQTNKNREPDVREIIIFRRIAYNSMKEKNQIQLEEIEKSSKINDHPTLILSSIPSLLWLPVISTTAG